MGKKVVFPFHYCKFLKQLMFSGGEKFKWQIISSAAFSVSDLYELGHFKAEKALQCS